jgi:hypothetical protein
MSTESQTAAATNGCRMESIIRALYPEGTFEYTGLIDFTIDGARVEVKSCQDRVYDNSLSGGARSGRFVFSDLQHQTLLENKGDYILLVHKDGVPIVYIRVPASKLQTLLGGFSGTKAVCWKTAIKGALA